MARRPDFKPFEIIAVNQHDFSVRSNGRNYQSEKPELKWRIGIIDYTDASGSQTRLHGRFLDAQGRPCEETFDFCVGSDNVQRVEFATLNIQVDVPETWRSGLVEPAAKPERALREDESIPELHPSYGVVTVGRTSGSRKLFMSPFNHQHFMTLTICRASRRRSLSNAHTYGEGELVEINLSESQWARMVSSVGDGSGVPCTINSVAGTSMPDCPETDEKATFQAEVEKAATKAAEGLRATYEAVSAILDKKSVTKGDREEILGKLSKAERDLSGNLPFVVKQFTERMGVITDEAKTEIQAFMDTAFRRAGLQALQEAGVVPLSLPEPKKE